MVHPHRLGCLHLSTHLILLLVVALKIRETRENQSGHAMSDGDSGSVSFVFWLVISGGVHYRNSLYKGIDTS